MAKNKVVKPMTEEQRRRILETPGVVVRRRKGPPEKPFFTPRIRVEEPISARELIGRDDDDEYDELPPR